MQTIDILSKVVIPILSILITTFLVPYIREKTSKEQRETALILVQAAVMAAEQIFNQKGQGQEKKIFVLNFLKDRGLKITEAELDVLIEASVKELNLQTI